MTKPNRNKIRGENEASVWNLDHLGRAPQLWGSGVKIVARGPLSRQKSGPCRMIPAESQLHLNHTFLLNPARAVDRPISHGEAGAGFAHMSICRYNPMEG